MEEGGDEVAIGIAMERWEVQDLHQFVLSKNICIGSGISQVKIVMK